jgi:hypothetical protein
MFLRRGVEARGTRRANGAAGTESRFSQEGLPYKGGALWEGFLTDKNIT